MAKRARPPEADIAPDGLPDGPPRDPYAAEALCARILERHRDRVSVRKARLATQNLARIIAAVLALSSRQGFHETSLRDLARETGLSMGGLYTYFDTKETLLLMILTEVVESVQAALAAAPPEVAARPRAHLRWLVETHIRLTEAMGPWFVFAFMEAKGFPASARRLATESELAVEQVFARVLEAGVAEGVFAVEDVTLTAALIKPLLQDWYVKRAKYARRGLPIERYVAGVIGLLEGAILARPSA